MYTTEISIFEITKGLYNTIKDKDLVLRRVKMMDDLLQSIHVLPTANLFAVEAAEIASSLRAKGKIIGDTDCLIAGMMKRNNIDKILTRNKKHFEGIKGIKVLEY